MVLSLYIQCAVPCQELFFFLFFVFFVLVLSLVFPACFVLVLFCTRCKYSFLRQEPLRDRLVNYAFIFNVTLSELWLVPSNLMKSCLKPSHLKEKKEDWENHVTKEFYKLLTMHMRILKKVIITWHCYMRQKKQCHNWPVQLLCLFQVWSTFSPSWPPAGN